MFAAVKDIKNFLPLGAAAINVGVVLRARMLRIQVFLHFLARCLSFDHHALAFK